MKMKIRSGNNSPSPQRCGGEEKTKIAASTERETKKVGLGRTNRRLKKKIS